MKEKNLKAGDIVSFHCSTSLDNQLYIEWKARSSTRSAVVGLSNPIQPVQMLRLPLR